MYFVTSKAGIVLKMASLHHAVQSNTRYWRCMSSLHKLKLQINQKKMIKIARYRKCNGRISPARITVTKLTILSLVNTLIFSKFYTDTAWCLDTSISISFDPVLTADTIGQWPIFWPIFWPATYYPSYIDACRELEPGQMVSLSKY